MVLRLLISAVDFLININGDDNSSASRIRAGGDGEDRVVRNQQLRLLAKCLLDLEELPRSAFCSSSDVLSHAEDMNFFAIKSNAEDEFLQLLRQCLQPKCGLPSPDMSFLNWEVWDAAMETILKLENAEDEIALSMRFGDFGFQKNPVDVCSQLQTRMSDDGAWAKELESRTREAVLKCISAEEKRLREILRTEDSMSRKMDNTWNRILEELANERGPWGGGAEDAEEVT
jgi:hypothetical protein